MIDLKCKSCRAVLVPVGTFYACASGDCERFATPVDYRGRTDEEAQIDAVRALVPSCAACNDTGYVPDPMAGEVTCGDCYNGDGTEASPGMSFSSDARRID